MSTQSQTGAETALAPVKFSRLARRGVLLGLSGAQLALVAAGALILGLYAHLLVLAVPVIATCLSAAFWTVGGRTLIDWGPIVLVWLWRSSGGQLAFRRRTFKPRPAGTLALPGDAARLRQWVDADTGAVMVHDPHAATLTAIVGVSHPAFVLLDPAEQHRRLMRLRRRPTPLQLRRTQIPPLRIRVRRLLKRSRAPMW